MAGFIAPAASGQLPGGTRALVTLAWLGFGIVLHASGQFVLGIIGGGAVWASRHIP